MSFFTFLIKEGDITPDQVESIQYALDLDLRDFLIKTKAITPGRVTFKWEQYYKTFKK